MEAMENLIIKGKVKLVLPALTGEGKKGEYKKQQIVIQEDNSRYENIAALTLWNYMVDTVKEGDNIIAYLSLQASEHNGRFINNVTAYKIEKQ